MAELFEKLRTLSVSSKERESLIQKCQENDWLREDGLPWQEDAYLEEYPYEFARLDTIEDLKAYFEYGNWAIRQGVVYKDLAFIQQEDGGDEWWVLKRLDNDWLHFESASFCYMAKRNPEAFEHTISCMHHATPLQCKDLEYMLAYKGYTPLAKKAWVLRDSSRVLTAADLKDAFKSIER